MIMTGIDCKKCVFYKKLQELEKENEVLKEKLERQREYVVAYKNFKYEEEQKRRKALEEIQRRIDKTLDEVLNG